MGRKLANRKRRRHSQESRLSAISLVEDQGDMVARAAREPGIHENLLRTWRTKCGTKSREFLDESEQDELARLRQEVSRLRMERDILKNARAFFEHLLARLRHHGLAATLIAFIGNDLRGKRPLVQAATRIWVEGHVMIKEFREQWSGR